MKSFRKVVVPVAGWGTRSLPASKNVPKEMLPIYNRPVIQYVVEEALRSGMTSAIFVTNRDKSVMVEKPAVAKAPSRLAVVGRYALFPDIFDYLDKVEPGHGGEIQLTDALKARAREKGMLAVKLAGIRFDAGNWSDYLTANIYFGLQDENLRYDLLEKLKNIIQFE